MKNRKRILIFPNSNTLSHVSRALTLCQWLAEECHEAHIAVSNSRKNWTQRFWPRCHGILELWEPSGKPFPSPGWFSDGTYCEACITSQEAVIHRVQPDLIISIFDFCAGISRGSRPLLSINGACMLPWDESVLGFAEERTAEREEQKRIFSTFWTYAVRSFTGSFEKRRMEIPSSALELLTGDFNFIYEIPEITGIHRIPPRHRYLGPIFWEGWDVLGEKVPWGSDESRFIVYLNSGTLMKNEQTMAAIINECLTRNLRLLVSSGDNGPSWTTDRLYCRPFLSPSDVLNRSKLVVCTGGVGACYMNLRYGIPSLVIPMQPEQATNGINIFQNGCGEVYRHNVIFLGDADRYHHPFDRESFGALVDRMVSGPSRYENCGRMRDLLAGCATRERFLSKVGEMT